MWCVWFMSQSCFCCTYFILPQTLHMVSLAFTFSVGICHIAALFLFCYVTKLFFLLLFPLASNSTHEFTFSVSVAQFLFGYVTKLFFLHLFHFASKQHMALHEYLAQSLSKNTFYIGVWIHFQTLKLT